MSNSILSEELFLPLSGVGMVLVFCLFYVNASSISSSRYVKDTLSYSCLAMCKTSDWQLKSFLYTGLFGAVKYSLDFSLSQLFDHSKIGTPDYT